MVSGPRLGQLLTHLRHLFHTNAILAADRRRPPRREAHGTIVGLGGRSQARTISEIRRSPQSHEEFIANVRTVCLVFRIRRAKPEGSLSCAAPPLICRPRRTIFVFALLAIDSASATIDPCLVLGSTLHLSVGVRVTQPPAKVKEISGPSPVTLADPLLMN